MPKYVISEGKISSFITRLMSMILGGLSLPPEIQDLAKKDPEFKRAVDDFTKSTLEFNKFMRKYRKKRSDRETEIWKSIPR